MANVDGESRGGARRHTGSAGDTELIFQVETFVPGKLPAWMLQDHYEEVAPNKEVFKLNPNWKFYFEEQKAGRCFLVVARNPEWDVVGYMAILIRPNPHYKDAIVAVDDSHYLMPMYRGQKLGARMIAFAEQEAERRGAVVFTMRCKADQPHGAIFEKLGYKLTDLVYFKDIRHAKPNP